MQPFEIGWGIYHKWKTEQAVMQKTLHRLIALHFHSLSKSPFFWRKEIIFYTRRDAEIDLLPISPV